MQTPIDLNLEARLANSGRPTTVAEWRQFVESLLIDQPCVYHRNLEVSALYAKAYLRHPTLYKWAGMAAFASHHVRLLLLPLKLGTTPSGAVDLAGTVARYRHVHMDDIDRVRQINNAIFADIFWAHLVYDASPRGLDALAELLGSTPEGAQMLEGFQWIERGRATLACRCSHSARARALEEVWRGNLKLLWHEQQAVVQPRFEQLSGRFARIFSLGSSLDFEARGAWELLNFFTSFYLYMLVRARSVLRSDRSWPRVSRLDHRWAWISGGIVPRYRRFEADPQRMRLKLGRIVESATALHDTVACSV